MDGQSNSSRLGANCSTFGCPVASNEAGRHKQAWVFPSLSLQHQQQGGALESSCPSHVVRQQAPSPARSEDATAHANLLKGRSVPWSAGPASILSNPPAAQPLQRLRQHTARQPPETSLLRAGRHLSVSPGDVGPASIRIASRKLSPSRSALPAPSPKCSIVCCSRSRSTIDPASANQRKAAFDPATTVSNLALGQTPRHRDHLHPKSSRASWPTFAGALPPILAITAAEPADSSPCGRHANHHAGALPSRGTSRNIWHRLPRRPAQRMEDSPASIMLFNHGQSPPARCTGSKQSHDAAKIDDRFCHRE